MTIGASAATGTIDAVQTIELAIVAQSHPSPVTLPIVNPSGSSVVIVAFVALLGPALDGVIVNVTAPPGATDVALAEREIVTSACPATPAMALPLTLQAPVVAVSWIVIGVIVPAVQAIDG